MAKTDTRPDEDVENNRIQKHYDDEFAAIERNYYKETSHPTDPNDKSDSPDSLKQSEKKGSDDKKAQDQDEGLYKNTAKHGLKNNLQNRLSNMTPAKWALLGGVVSMLLVALALAAIIFSLFGTLKVVHFGTVLRSAGLARFTIQMQRQFSRTTLDAATLTDNSTGSMAKKLGKRSLGQKLLGINPQKRILELGQQNKLKFEFQKNKTWGGLRRTNEFKGVVIDGQNVNLDDIAKELGNDKPYNKLSTRQKLAVQSVFNERVRYGIADRLSVQGMITRASIYSAVRQAAGISMFKWTVDKAKEYFGKKASDNIARNVEDTAKSVDGDSTRPKSAFDSINDSADEVREETEKAAKEGRNVGQIRARNAKIASTTSKISTAALAATAACLIHDLDTSFKEAGQQTELRAARMGHDSLTTTDQIKNGEDVNEYEVEAEAKRWESADEAALYKQHTGSPLTADDQEEVAQIPNIKGPASNFAKVISIANTVIKAGTIASIPKVGDKIQNVECKAVLNQWVQFGIAGGELIVGVFTAGTSEGILQGVKAGVYGAVKLGATVGAGHLLGTFLDNAVKSAAGLDYSGYQNNETLYNQTYVGEKYLEQTGNRQATYGRPLTAAEASAEQTTAMQEVTRQNSERSFTERYFAIDNPNSLIGHVAAITPTSLADTGNYAQRGLGFIGSALSSPQVLLQRFSSLFMPRAIAAEPMLSGQPFGVNEIGWSTAEWKRITTDPDFSVINGKLQDAIEPHLDELDEKYGGCYGYVLQKDKPEGNCVKDCNMDEIDCLSTTEALKWRWYKAESFSAECAQANGPDGNCAPGNSAAAQQNEQAGADIDLDNLYKDSTNVACAQGTEDVGNATGKYAAYHGVGNPVNIKLCRIKGFKCTCAAQMNKYTGGKIDSKGDVVVNSRASGAWLALYENAKKAGHNLAANSAFRTMDYQRSLCPCNGVTVALPGNSNHQMGLAIDIQIPGSPLSTGNCKTVGGICTPSADPSGTWKWLHENSQKYSLKQYSREFWHFSPDGH